MLRFVGTIVSYIYGKLSQLRLKNKQINKKTNHLLDYRSLETNLIVSNFLMKFCQIAFLCANTAFVVRVFYVRNSECE